MFLEILHNNLNLSFLALLLLIFFGFGVKHLVYLIRDNLGLRERQTVATILKKSRSKNDDIRHFNITTFEDYSFFQPDSFFLHFEIESQVVVQEVSLELYESVIEDQSIFVVYTITNLSNKIKVRNIYN